jgi:hypothetical protein
VTVVTQPSLVVEPFVVNIDCKDKVEKEGWDNCMCKQLCAKIRKMDEARKKGAIKATPGARTLPAYKSTKAKYIKNFNARVAARKGVRRQFLHKCAADKYMNEIYPGDPTAGGTDAPFNADHMHEAAQGGSLTDLSNLKMLDSRVNHTISFERYQPEGKNKDQPIKAMASCNCPNGP